ncbi:hypothetical protein H9P43_003089 [Blastocladiella emersonii ATCC 22665]|nr:hypothetical protein H9P43_003089 [Blastocladiella emersonii ATCC 22665]
MKSLRDLVDDCNNVPHSLDRWVAELNAARRQGADDDGPHGFAFLTADGVRVGLLSPPVTAALAAESDAITVVSATELEVTRHASDGADAFAARSQRLAAITARWRAASRFPALQGWRDELYTVYGAGGVPAFTVERAASGLLGVRTYGCHLTAYTLPVGAAHPHPDLHLWIARRSLTKPTFPGMLDNTAAGGLPFGQAPFECMVRECAEEASVSEEFARDNVRPAGAVSYYQRQDHLPSLGGVAGPETQFVFDLQVGDDFKPVINDGEVHGFKKVRVDAALELMRQGEFKPNCAVVLIDFLVRHGYITAENEPDYLEIVHGIHRPLEWEFPGPARF